MTRPGCSCAPPPEGAPPLNGQPLPLEFVNTVHPVRGVMRDGFASPELVAWWLSACRSAFRTDLPDEELARVTAADAHCFALLRDSARRLTEALVRRQDPEPWDVAQINRASALGGRWPALRWEAGGRPSPLQCGTPPIAAVQSEIAQAVIDMLTGSSGTEPTPCEAPGCVFFFDASRSRRQWCSSGCGNRARAARHYARHHAPSSVQSSEA
ncbi:CGNR zinc finger domain-containing protein [Streptomyces sp. NBC_01218]|uniref:CGNR zinc finger domain-containing protein n=1 Tax=unclassified Streptomyces TaxID=2593676 RepID=UPI0023B92916|nr:MULTISPECIES: CGNR zinc finger domain-containing protein [unclassified Streptomyces]WEH39231.1 CGNR zinc finger domain-containing protein [Streptomyces sp. AM 2-1-1]WSQ50881.1 CGNR zinc finger domain-containing protein [Streptomyces sp. NBC_01218]